MLSAFGLFLFMLNKYVFYFAQIVKSCVVVVGQADKRSAAFDVSFVVKSNIDSVFVIDS